jgi:hypothetical protein
MALKKDNFERIVEILQKLLYNTRPLGPLQPRQYYSTRSASSSHKISGSAVKTILTDFYCKILFWKQIVFCAKKPVDDRQKDRLEILKRVNKELLQRLTQETNLSFGTVQLILKKDLHFFSIVCLLCMKLALDNKIPHNRQQPLWIILIDR